MKKAALALVCAIALAGCENAGTPIAAGPTGASATVSATAVPASAATPAGTSAAASPDPATGSVKISPTPAASAAASTSPAPLTAATDAPAAAAGPQASENLQDENELDAKKAAIHTAMCGSIDLMNQDLYAISDMYMQKYEHNDIPLSDAANDEIIRQISACAASKAAAEAKTPQEIQRMTALRKPLAQLGGAIPLLESALMSGPLLGGSLYVHWSIQSADSADFYLYRSLMLAHHPDLAKTSMSHKQLLERIGRLFDQRKAEKVDEDAQNIGATQQFYDEQVHEVAGLTDQMLELLQEPSPANDSLLQLITDWLDPAGETEG